MFLRCWRHRRLLQVHRIDDAQWRACHARLSFLQRLTPEEDVRLRALCVIFLHEKDIVPAASANLDSMLTLAIAMQACLPILNLDIDYYNDWRSVVVYPREFVPQREYLDDAGVVHTTRYPVLAESWLQGPIILSAADVVSDDDVNIVIHECAHKLDMLNGDANGFPPLHRTMDANQWSRDFQAAYDELCARVDADEDTMMDPYAAESPGEFFAVASEMFFQFPTELQTEFPAIYRQLRRFYRQDPLGI